MARFILVCGDRTEPAADWDAGVDAGARFFAGQTSDRVVTRRLSALDGRCEIAIVARQGAPACVHTDESMTVLVEGGPYRRGRPVGPEAVSAMYRQHGAADFAAELDGAWVIAILDEDSGTLIVANDRFGLKPAYRARANGAVFVSSSPGALVRAGWVPATPNPRMVARYAACHYRSVYGAPETFFRDIELLRPATLWEVAAEGEREREYWQLDPAAATVDDPRAAGRYREALLRMMDDSLGGMHDGPPAVALSGGIDSGTIAGLMHAVTGTRPDAISLTYGGTSRFDESELISASVRDHIAEWCRLSMGPDDPLADLPDIYRRFDSPLATVSIYAYDYLYREGRQVGRSFVSGAGGDQLQAGNYPYFLYNLADLKYGRSPRYEPELSCWIRNHSTPEFPKSRSTAEAFFDRHVDPLVPGALRSTPLPLVSEDILDRDLLARAGDLAAPVAAAHGSWVRTYTVQEYHYDAVPPVTEAKDVIEWSWDVSVGSPFFGREIVEFCWALPAHLKIDHGVNKVLSRRALRGICADDVLDTVAKAGFNAPFGSWLRDGMRSWATELLGDGARVSDVYAPGRLEEIMEQHLSAQADHSMLLWQAINLELWLRSWAP